MIEITENNTDTGEKPTKCVPDGFHGRKGRSGPPRSNRNRLRHGLRGGQLPKDAKYIEWRMNAFRRQIEGAVLTAKGESTFPTPHVYRPHRPRYAAVTGRLNAGGQARIGPGFNRTLSSYKTHSN